MGKLNKSACEIQKKLNILYSEVFTQDNTKDLKDKDKLSAPLLIQVYDSYINANIRIMYVGKEPNHWLTAKSIDKDKRGLNGTLSSVGIDIKRLLNRYNKRMTRKDKWGKHAFFKQYKNIKDQLVDNDIGSGSIVWNNLFKMAYDNGHSYSKNSKNHSSKLNELSKELFLKELEILNPEILIFVTGSSYDKVIKETLVDYKTIEVIIPKKLWKFKYQDKICYRTVHPDSIRFIKKDKRVDYYQMIINDIKQERGL